MEHRSRRNGRFQGFGVLTVLLILIISACTTGSESKGSDTSRTTKQSLTTTTSTTTTTTTTSTTTTSTTTTAPPPSTDPPPPPETQPPTTDAPAPPPSTDPPPPPPSTDPPPPPGEGVPVISRVAVPEGSNLVFLTIDDGWVQRSEFTQRFIDAGVPVTLFPTIGAVEKNPDYFRAWLDNGASLGNHTITHPDLTGLGPGGQRDEICGATQRMEQLLGRHTTMLRPPYGSYDDNTRAVLKDCGMSSIITWRAEVKNGTLRLQAGDHLQPGDIILMHLRDTFDADFTAALDQVRADGMELGVLPAHLPSGN